MILSQEAWMDLRRFKALAEAGATWAEIARESGHDWRTVKRYLATDAPTTPPAPAKRGPGPRKIDPYAHLIDAWLRKQPKLKASVIWERLVTEHGFCGHYQRVKVYVRENRARLTQAEPTPAGFHRRFEVLAGAQAQVDWGDEGEIQTPTGPRFLRCPTSPMWSATGTPAGSARTPWSALRPATTRCPGVRSAPAPGSSCGSPPPRSRSGRWVPVSSC
jgi:hypothetical protein